MELIGNTLRRLGARRALRGGLALLAAVTATLYVLVGLEVVRVVEVVPGGNPELLSFGLAAGAAFLAGAACLVFADRRWLWALGALFQVVTIVMYFVVAPERTPHVEAWGLTIKALQLVLLAGLLYLLSRPRSDARSPAGEPNHNLGLRLAPR